MAFHMRLCDSQIYIKFDLFNILSIFNHAVHI